jgi:hypothetical protein
MKRRDALHSIAASVAAVGVPPKLLQSLDHGELTDDEIEALLRKVAEVEPRPNEAESVRAFLRTRAGGTRTGVDLQPAFTFDAEVEP